VVSEVEAPHDTMGIHRAVSFWTVRDGSGVAGREYSIQPGTGVAGQSHQNDQRWDRTCTAASMSRSPTP
jgi:hypothetical protein